mmetsp:Transcript_33065/g.37954  ORF Transcript_33065/g.37954 Transcript_33065/m.37954 type:complete len:101 (+) Transcript_33065:885-1187(+)
MPGRIQIRPQQFRMSFIIAHSSEKVEGVMGTTTNMNTEKYIRFLNTLFLKLQTVDNVSRSRLVIVADNCSFHRSKRVRQELKNLGIVFLFIPPYSPEINA